MGMNTDAVQRLYVAYFNRPADPVSLAVFEAMLPTDRVATQAELQVIAETYFSPSAEYAARYSGMSNAEIINTLYQNLFGRDAEPEGLLSWTGKLNTGEETVASIALQLSYSAQGTDADAIAAKIDAANSFTTEVASSTDNITGFSGNEAAASARDWLSTVTDAASAATAKAGVTAAVSDAIVAQNPPATPTNQTLSLTTGVDSLTGGAGNDTFDGSQSGGLNTLTNGDVLVGGDGSDTLVVNMGAATAALDTTGIETVQITATGAATLNAGGSTGIDSLQSQSSTAALTVNNLQMIPTVTLNTNASATNLQFSNAALAGTCG